MASSSLTRIDYCSLYCQLGNSDNRNNSLAISSRSARTTQDTSTSFIFSQDRRVIKMPRWNFRRRRNGEDRNPFKARYIGIALQLTITFLNAFVWGVSVLLVICGYVIGVGSDTIRINSPRDLRIATPATILVIYGVLLIMVSTVGCFSAVAARVIVSITYAVLILSYIIFDSAAGYGFLMNTNSLEKFYESVNISLEQYPNVDVGIFPTGAVEYWDHLQSRGKCCGLMSYEDWRETNFSRQSKNIPDSCCNEEYSYRYCGERVFRHPDTEEHSTTDILYVEGCMFVFPSILRLPQSKGLHVLTNMVGSFLIICLVFTVVIVALVLTRKFRPEEGIDNLEYTEPDPKMQQDLQEEISEVGSGEQVGQPPSGQWTAKVSPEPILVNDDQNDSRRVLFKNSGPNLIPSQHAQPSQQVVYLAGPNNMARVRPQTSFEARPQNRPKLPRPNTSYPAQPDYPRR